MKNKYRIIGLVLTFVLAFCGCEGIDGQNGNPDNGEIINEDQTQKTAEIPMTIEAYYNQPDIKAAKDKEISALADNASALVKVEWTAEGDVFSYIYTTNTDLTEEEVRDTFNVNRENSKNMIEMLKAESGAEKAAIRFVMKKEDGTVFSDVTFFEDGTYDGTLGGVHVDEETPEPVTVESYFSNAEHATAKTTELDGIASATATIDQIEWKAEGDTFTYIYHFNVVLSAADIETAAQTYEANAQETVDTLKWETGAAAAKVRIIFIDATGEEVYNVLLEGQ